MDADEGMTVGIGIEIEIVFPAAINLVRSSGQMSSVSRSGFGARCLSIPIPMAIPTPMVHDECDPHASW
jgi:hypothetical protein